MVHLLRPLLLLGTLLLPLASTLAQDLVPEAPSAVLLDQVSGRILFQKNPDQPIPPASLTKLMTLHLAWKALSEGRIHPGDLVPITAETTGSAVPPGSSLMFLEPGQRVTVKELMLGLAVDSGNDAGMTLARHLAGSQGAFVAAMDQEARALGLTQTVFFDAFGYDPRNQTTAADFARFCRLYLAAHPQSLETLHNVRELAFPLAENLAPGDRRKVKTILQPNRNTLLGAYPGADGLKTGYIEESGYNLAATAQRGPQRLVAVILGIQARDAAEGTRVRTAAAARLLDFGFGSFPLRALPLPEPGAIRIWFGEPGHLIPVPKGPTVFPLSDQEASGITVRWVGPRELVAPLSPGTPVGQWIWSHNGQEFHRIDLTTPQEIGLAPWWTGLWDRIVLFFRGLTGSPEPRAAVPRTGW